MWAPVNPIPRSSFSTYSLGPCTTSLSSHLVPQKYGDSEVAFQDCPYYIQNVIQDSEVAFQHCPYYIPHTDYFQVTVSYLHSQQ